MTCNRAWKHRGKLRIGEIIAWRALLGVVHFYLREVRQNIIVAAHVQNVCLDLCHGKEASASPPSKALTGAARRADFCESSPPR